MKKAINMWRRMSAFAVAAIVMSSSPIRAVCQCNKKMSAEEITKYRQILENKEYIEDSDHLIYDDADFMLYDINNDGRKDLIISGPFGLRSVFGTVVYSYDGKKFHCTTKRGDVAGISKKGIELYDRDYEGIGEIIYESVVVYQLNTSGKLKEKTMSDSVTNMIESSLEKKYYKYNNSGKKIKISKSAYKKLRKKYNLKQVDPSNGMHEINNSNIETYINE